MAAQFLWLDQKAVINLDKVLRVDFYRIEFFEQNGKRTDDFENIDPDLPWEKVSEAQGAVVTYAVPVSEENSWTGKTSLDLYRERFRGEPAEKLLEHFQGQEVSL